MHNYGVILKKLRVLKGYSLKNAARHIGKSVGWLSEIKNNRGRARITTQEFDRIVQAYKGEDCRRLFRNWVANHHRNEKPTGPSPHSSEGAIIKHFRKKSGLTLDQAASHTQLSQSHLSNLENGRRNLSSLQPSLWNL